MARHAEFYQEWLEHDGKAVWIDKHKYLLRVSTFDAIYPYPYKGISVYAEPINKNAGWYREIKRKLQDDWSTNVLESDPVLQADILEQCRNLCGAI